jgi:guanylate kinase
MELSDRIILLLGPSGTGKSSILRELCCQHPQIYQYPRPYTTRPLRTNETEKVHLNSVDFFEQVRSGNLFIPEERYGHFYSPAKSEFDEIFSQNKTPVIDWPVQSIKKIKRFFISKRLISIYLIPPNKKTLKNRLDDDSRDVDGSRYTFALEELSDIEKGKYDKLVDHYVINKDGITESTKRIHQIIMSYERVDERSIFKGGQEMDEPFKLKNDKYRSVRGGEAHLLDISCAKCGLTIIKYQKDGKGDLIRCYLNRIFSPPQYEALQSDPTIREPKNMPNLSCLKCNQLIGTPMLYEDGRLAFRLRKGTYSKKRVF